MNVKYFLAALFGGLIGACCVLIVVYVTNTGALEISPANVNDAVSSIHSRINDFYIFAGIVITLLLAINVGVYLKADGEVEKYVSENFDRYAKRLRRAILDSEKRTDENKLRNNIKRNKHE